MIALLSLSVPSIAGWLSGSSHTHALTGTDRLGGTGPHTVHVWNSLPELGEQTVLNLKLNLYSPSVKINMGWRWAGGGREAGDLQYVTTKLEWGCVQKEGNVVNF